ncbi:MAG: ArnT family glycosyltransferase [Candidatus Rokuibacteriota bacterium]
MRARRPEAAAVLALLAVFVLHCHRAERVDAPTYDEPTHLAAGYLHLTQGDYRFQVDHPPLAKMLAAAPLVIAGARPPAASPPIWRDDLSNRFEHRAWARRFLYGTPGNRADSLVRLGRLVSVTIAVGLLALVWAWSRALHGPVPALLVLGLGAADANLVAHGHLVTPDVAVTAAMLAAVYALWRTLRAARAGRVLAAGLCLGLGLATKYTAILLLPIFALLLVLRGLAAEPWPLGIRGRMAATRWSRLGTAAALGLLILGVAWGTVWAAYRWRAAAAPGTPIELTDRALRVWFAEPRPWPAEALGLAVRQRLLPDAWAFGILYLWADGRLTPRTSYLAGRLSSDGWWYYFPATLGLKVPLPTLGLAAVGLAAATVGAWRRSQRPDPAIRAGPLMSDERVLAGFALLTLAGIVLGAAMLSALNIGLRQVLPVYPPLLMAAACGIRVCLRAGRAWGTAVVVAALVWTWTASSAVAPYHLAYFNELAGGPEKGARWLVDSNLDWGQALRVLPGWLRARGIDRVNLCYFGTADPIAYGFDHVPLPGCTVYDEPASTPRLPGYLAISATHLAGVHFAPELRAWYQALLERARPVGVVGHAIHVYEIPGREVPAPGSPESRTDR